MVSNRATHTIFVVIMLVDCLVALTLGSSCALGEEDRQRRAFDILFSLRRAEITLGEPAFLDFVFENCSSLPVDLDLGSDDLVPYRVVVSFKGGPAGEIRPSYQGGFRPSGHVRIEAGRQYRRSLLLTQWFKAQEPGEYTLEAQFSAVLTVGRQLEQDVEHSQTLLLQVMPADRARLGATIAELTDAASQRGDLVAAREAAEALALIEDPQVTKALGKVALQGPAVQSVAVQGLARLKTPDAVGSLISLLESGDGELVGLVCLTLHQLRPELEDARLRGAVAAALSQHGMRASCPGVS